MTPAGGRAAKAPELFSAAGVAVRDAGGVAIDVPWFALEAGGAAALLGGSGAGKTTLLAGLFGLAAEPPVAFRGTRTFAGVPWPDADTGHHRSLLRQDVCVLPQDARAALDPLVPLGEQLREAAPPGAARPDVALRELGVGDGEALLARFPHEVSGGQAQCALLALAILRRPRLLVADEPSTGLDAERAAELARRFAVLRENGTALCVATHDRTLAGALGAALWTIRDRRLERNADALAPWPARERAPRVSERTADNAEPLLAATGVAVRRGGRSLLEHADLALCAGESVALLGSSGAGKTTLARVLAGTLRPDRGSVARRTGRTGVQLLFQDAYASLTPHRTIASLLAESRAPGFDQDAELAALRIAPDLLARRAAELSGGERRRMALLRALSVCPQVLLLDEPTAELDRATAVDVVASLLACQRRTGVAMLWITHDRSLAAAVADRTVMIENGRTCSPAS